MSHPLEDYALLADTETAALVRKDGAMDWLCLPRFDSDACFAALLGDERHGHWTLGAKAEVRRVERRYRPRTLILETDQHVDGGVLRIVDFMPPRNEEPDVVRIVRAERGRVAVRMRLAARFGYGEIAPMLRVDGRRAEGWAGPDHLILESDVPLSKEDEGVVAEFELDEGEEATFVLAWHRSYERPPKIGRARELLEYSQRWWEEWAESCSERGPLRDEILASCVVLKSLTFSPSGGIVAAPTTSLPERLGGCRNWDYRYCWLRDATFVLLALMNAGFRQEAAEWRDWLIRAVAAEPRKIRILYGLAGERHHWEHELPWLPGYERSRPVRVGNAAVGQLQLDVFGEVLDCFHQARKAGIPPDDAAWEIQRALLAHLETIWKEPDEGIWEVRGGRRAFTHSKVMAWVAFDRAVKSARRFGRDGAVERWAKMRDVIHAEVCEKGFDHERNTFTQSYGSKQLDASSLLIPEVGFLRPDDPRVRGTIAAIERELSDDGLIRRYDNDQQLEGLPGHEGVFLACSFWMVDALAMTGRTEDARRMFERLLSLRNDVGLLSEEYDTGQKRLVGNFPQAFSHVALINSAHNLTHLRGPAAQRGENR